MEGCQFADRWGGLNEAVTNLSQYVDTSRHMDAMSISGALSGLAQPTRLEVFRLLIGAEPVGVAAGEIARRIAVPHNTMSSHLAVLANCGLVSSERKSRSIIYRADLLRFREIILYLINDCCDGKRELCTSLLADLTPCCPQATRSPS